MPLVLSVKENESVILDAPGGRVISITAVRCRPSGCRLVIDAPADVEANRRKVREAKRGLRLEA